MVDKALLALLLHLPAPPQGASFRDPRRAVSPTGPQQPNSAPRVGEIEGQRTLKLQAKPRVRWAGFLAISGRPVLVATRTGCKSGQGDGSTPALQRAFAQRQ